MQSWTAGCAHFKVCCKVEKGGGATTHLGSHFTPEWAMCAYAVVRSRNDLPHYYTLYLTPDLPSTPAGPVSRTSASFAISYHRWRDCFTTWFKIFSIGSQMNQHNQITFISVIWRILGFRFHSYINYIFQDH